MRTSELYRSKFFKASDASDGDDLVLTIKSVRLELVGNDDEAATKPVVRFSESEKILVLNRTNCEIVEKLYGFDTDAWVGKKIVLYSTEVAFKSKMVPALRVRAKTAGNGANGQGDALRLWNAFVSAQGITEEQVYAALGTTDIAKWLSADPARNITDALMLVSKARRS